MCLISILCVHFLFQIVVLIALNIFCLSFYLLYLSYLLSKTMDCFSGHLMSSASGQKLFCEVCSASKCSFDEFVGDKVVSPSYPSAILAPPLNICSHFSGRIATLSIADIYFAFICSFLESSFLSLLLRRVAFSCRVFRTLKK